VDDKLATGKMVGLNQEIHCGIIIISPRILEGCVCRRFLVYQPAMYKLDSGSLKQL
jgi:hypothetical protein